MEEKVYALFTSGDTLRPQEVAKKLNIEKKEANRHLYNLHKGKHLSVSRTEAGGDPRYSLGEGKTTIIKDAVSEEDILNQLKNMELNAPELALKILDNDTAPSVSIINSKLNRMEKEDKVKRRHPSNRAYPLWSI